MPEKKTPLNRGFSNAKKASENSEALFLYFFRSCDNFFAIVVAAARANTVG